METMDRQDSANELDHLPNIYIRTPLIESIALQKYCEGRRVFLKLENVQPCGSFKLRGISELCKHAKAKGFTKLVCSSGGNAGLATAYVAMKLGMQCEIVVSRNTSNEVCETIREYGATIVRYGDVWHESNEQALEIVKSSDHSFYVHPFDNAHVWHGNSTMVDEIAQDIGAVAPSLIVTACGGGGLSVGLVEGIRRQNWQDQTKLVIMETECTASFNAAVKAGGKVVEVQNIKTIVNCLAANRVCEQVVKCFHDDAPALLSRVVTDKDAAQACLQFANDHRFLVGLSCGTGLSALYKGIVQNILDDNEEEREVLFDKRLNYMIHRKTNDGPVVIIVCGGNEMTIQHMQHLQTFFNL